MANGNEKLQGLLASPGFNLGIGLLSQGLGRPRSFGAGLLGGLQAGQTLQGQAQENLANRRLLQQQARQRNAQNSLIESVTQGAPTSVTGPGPGMGAVERVQTPQQEQLALLAQANPEAFTQGLVEQQFGSERAQPSIIRSLQAVGIDPESEQGRKLVVENIRGRGGDELKSLLAQVQLERELLDLKSRGREVSQEQKEQQQKKLRRLDSVQTTAENIGRMSEMLGILERTGELVPGVGFEQGRRDLSGLIQGVTSAFGAGSQERAAANTAFDELRRLAESEALKRAGSILSEIGTITNAKFEAARETLANPSNTPAAMRLAMADILDATVRGAKIEGVELENADRIEQQIETLRESAQQSLEAGLPDDAPGPVDQGNGQKDQGNVIDLGDGVQLRFD